MDKLYHHNMYDDSLSYYLNTEYKYGIDDNIIYNAIIQLIEQRCLVYIINYNIMPNIYINVNNIDMFSNISKIHLRINDKIYKIADLNRYKIYTHAYLNENEYIITHDYKLIEKLYRNVKINKLLKYER